jgi:hypothetical protein
MALIYNMSTGTIVSENTGTTTVSDYDDLPEYSVALQTVQPEPQPARSNPCSEYMMHIQELCKDL